MPTRPMQFTGRNPVPGFHWIYHSLCWSLRFCGKYPARAAIAHQDSGVHTQVLTLSVIMLLTNETRVFYYPGARFDTSLLIQALIMIAIQLVLLKVALDHRPSPSSKGGEAAMPFAASREGDLGVPRPFHFWQWRSPKP